MDFVNKAMGGGNSQNTQGTGNSVNEQVANDKSSGGGFLGGIGDKLNSAAGGGKESEKNEDYLDKGKLSCTHAFTSWSPNSCPLPFYLAYVSDLQY
jgi:hypothetical protein